MRLIRAWAERPGAVQRLVFTVVVTAGKLDGGWVRSKKSFRTVFRGCRTLKTYLFI